MKIDELKIKNSEKEYSLWDIITFLRQGRFVDLTHPFDDKIPHSPLFPSLQRQPLYNHEQHGFYAEQLQMVGQWGTHVDAPYHFHAQLRKLHEISPEEMILPVVVIDISQEVTKNPDYVITSTEIKKWEEQNLKIPKNSFVALRTDWSKRWPDEKLMQNKDEQGIAHYPGWSLDALQFLCLEREITAIGHETTDTDSGKSCSQNNYECEAYILGQNKYQIEMLTNLDLVPATGAIIICSFAKLKNGAGFPARVFAIA